MRTADLKGAALYWALAKAKGWKYKLVRQVKEDDRAPPVVDVWVENAEDLYPNQNTTVRYLVNRTSLVVDLMEEHRIAVRYNDIPHETGGAWWASSWGKVGESRGTTVTEAVLRCVVAQYLGASVRLPTTLRRGENHE